MMYSSAAGSGKTKAVGVFQKPLLTRFFMNTILCRVIGRWPYLDVINALGVFRKTHRLSNMQMNGTGFILLLYLITLAESP